MTFKEEVMNYTKELIQNGVSDESLVHNELIEIGRRLDKLDVLKVNVNYLHRKFNYHKNKLTNVQKVNNFLIDMIRNAHSPNKVVLTEFVNGTINRYEQNYEEEEF